MCDMSGRRLFPQDRSLKWLSACVLVLGFVSFIGTLTMSGEADAASWAQPGVVDGEEVDPSEDVADPIPSDHHVVDRLVFTGLRIGIHLPPPPQQTLACHGSLFDLASRPPPVL